MTTCSNRRDAPLAIALFVRSLAPIAFAIVAALFLGPTPAAAEDQRTVGSYVVVASFASTPVYPQEANAFVVRIRSVATGEPVTGLERSRRVRVGVPNQVTETWNLEPVPGEPGAYRVTLGLPRAGTFFLPGRLRRHRWTAGQRAVHHRRPRAG